MIQVTVTRRPSQDLNPSSLTAKISSEPRTGLRPWHQHACAKHSDTSWKVILSITQLLKYLPPLYFTTVKIESLKDNTPQNVNLVMKATVLNGH